MSKLSLAHLSSGAFGIIWDVLFWWRLGQMVTVSSMRSLSAWVFSVLVPILKWQQGGFVLCRLLKIIQSHSNYYCYCSMELWGIVSNRHNWWVLQLFLLSAVCTYGCAFKVGWCKIQHTSCVLVCRLRCRLCCPYLFYLLWLVRHNHARDGESWRYQSSVHFNFCPTWRRK